MHVHYDIDGPLGDVVVALLVGIIVGYLIIAWQFWRHSRNDHMGAAPPVGSARSAFVRLMTIFILCSLCGYIPRLIPVPIPVMVFLHIALFAVTWRYILGRQVVLIAGALSRA